MNLMTDKPEIEIVIETVMPKGDKPLRTLDPSKWKIEITDGAPLRTLEDEHIMEMVEGTEMFAETLFGTIQGIAVKRGDDWSVGNEYVVAMVKWSEKQECWISWGAYDRAAARELEKEMAGS